MDGTVTLGGTPLHDTVTFELTVILIGDMIREVQRFTTGDVYYCMHWTYGQLPVIGQSSFICYEEFLSFMSLCTLMLWERGSSLFLVL